MAADTKNNNFKQVAFGIESQFSQGDPSTLAAADAKLRISSASAPADDGRIATEFLTASFTPEASRTGALTRGLAFETEIAGPTSATVTDQAQWGKFLRCCGVRVDTLARIAIGAVADGPFQHLEVVTQATSAAEGLVIMNTKTGEAYLYLIETSGEFDGTNVITGATSGATVTPSGDDVDYGLAYRPWTHALSEIPLTGSVTGGPFTAGEKITGGTSGATGYVWEETADGATGLLVRHVAGTFESETLTGASSGATVSATGDAAQTHAPSGYMRLFEDGGQQSAKGLRGSFTLNLQSGQPGALSFDFNGQNDGHGDAPLLASIAYERTKGPRFVSATISLDHSTAAPFTELPVTGLVVTGQNTLAPVEAADSGNGVEGMRIGGRDHTVALTANSVQAGQYDWLTKHEADTTLELKAQWGTVASNIFIFYAPALQVESGTPGESNALRNDEWTLRPTGTKDDADWVLCQI